LDRICQLSFGIKITIKQHVNSMYKTISYIHQQKYHYSTKRFRWH